MIPRYNTTQTYNTSETHRKRDEQEKSTEEIAKKAGKANVSMEELKKLWNLYSKDDKTGEENPLAGPMDILRQVGQFLLILSGDEKNSAVENGLHAGSMEQNLQGMLYANHTGAKEEVQSVSNVDLETIEKLASYVESGANRVEKTPEGVRINVPEHVLPQTNIVLKEVGGVMQVQISSDNADAIALLGKQGNLLQQMLENKLNTNVVVEVNAERVTRKESDENSSKDNRKQQQEEQENEE